MRRSLEIPLNFANQLALFEANANERHISELQCRTGSSQAIRRPADQFGGHEFSKPALNRRERPYRARAIGYMASERASEYLVLAASANAHSASSNWRDFRLEEISAFWNGCLRAVNREGGSRHSPKSSQVRCVLKLHCEGIFEFAAKA